MAQKKKHIIIIIINEVLNLYCELDSENINPMVSQDTPAYDYHHTKFGCKRISSSVDIVTLTLNLKIATQSFA